MVCAPPWRSISCPPVPPCGPSSAAQTMTVARRAESHHDRRDDRSERPRRVQQRRQRGHPPSRFGEAHLGRWRTAGRLPLLESTGIRGRNRAARSQGGAASFGRGVVDRERAVRRAATEHDAADCLRATPLIPQRRASAGSAGMLRWWPPACARCPSSRASPARRVSNRATGTPPPRPGETSG